MTYPPLSVSREGRIPALRSAQTPAWFWRLAKGFGAVFLSLPFVLAFVPWVELAPALFLADGADGRPDATLSVALGFGIDWLIDEHWSLTPYLDLHQVGGVDRTPGYLVAGVRFGWRWTLGDPFAP